MALQCLVDWKGRPVNPQRQGGVKATMFIYFLVVMTNIGNIPMLLNVVSYLHGKMHMGIADASTTATNFFGAICVFTFFGAFISDSYVKRFYTILIFAPIEIVGYMLLACQAHFPSLHPPPCDIVNHPSECTTVSGRNLSLLTLGLYVIPIGEGAVRVCAAALGGDQFDGDDPRELRGKASFFNWYAFCISLGGFVGLVFVVWVQNNEGWDLGFVLSALVALLGTLVLVAGLPFYRHQKPTGSPLTRILQVFVAAFRKRNLSVPEDLVGMHGTTSIEVLERTSGFKFLDKAAVDDGDARPWSQCTVTQVEEAKIILRMLPVFVSSVLGYLPIPLLLTFTVQQGWTMDTRLGSTHVPPASLFVIPIVFQMLILVVYDRAVVPWLRRATGYAGGITHLQRIGVGFASNVVALAVAAAVEARRRHHGGAAAAEMSVFWLTPQFFLLGVMDVTSFVGLLEFFYSEASAGMKSIGGAVFFCILGIASWLGSFLIRVVNRVTARHGRGTGWLDGASLSAGRLDLFYWLLALFGLVALLLYLLCAWRYTYRHHPSRMPSAMEDYRVSPASKKLDAAL
ncbi:protein NRT1/ PTR FAMILY 4.3-like isoform X1 [Miscanthus floridulus]|uniref:protein NRT1/ PTR FAMILY 4.3-like isoform X1 n=2 Tax=Miscanthus floridulus TaxID=154761 RepID=UPI003458F3D4